MGKNRIVVFDLDDTLYKEVEFLKSAYREIGDYLEAHYMVNGVYDRLLWLWQNGGNAFEEIIKEHHLPVTIDELVRMYRDHKPLISLEENTCEALSMLSRSCVLGLITDGRSLTQRNKIRALGLERFFENDNILISEETGFTKPASEPFRLFMVKYPNHEYCYVGDNPEKDFIAPNMLGWRTVCLIDDGRNIHQQVFNLPDEYLPEYQVDRIDSI